MKLSNALLSLVLGTGALGQNTLDIQGIKIVSSAFDSKTHTATLTLVNDTPLNITAWGYCIDAENAPNSTAPRHSFCTLHDALNPVIEQKLEVAKRPFLSDEPNCSPGCRFIHPGQTETIAQDYSSAPEVVDATIKVTFVVYGNGAVEALSSEQGQLGWQAVASMRRAFLKRTQELVRRGREVLSDANNQHAAISMIESLKQMASDDQRLQGELDNFKKPEWRKGNDQEFIPTDERSYLQQYVADQQFKVVELSKNQVQGGAL